jgi:dihydrofolate reductase
MHIVSYQGGENKFYLNNMKAIIAVNNLGFIGKGNTLLWHNKEDLKHFKKLTDGGILLVGYNTFSELPVLPNRGLIIDTRGEYKFNVDWCIGGKKTYEKYCHIFTELHISHIDNNQIGDVTFPDLTNLNPDCKIFNYQY